MSTAVITCHFNPCGYEQPRRNLRRFADLATAQGANLFIRELMFGRHCGLSHSAQVATVADRSKHVLWQKEALMNDMARRLPAEYDTLVFCDADVEFRNPDWLDDTERALERSDIAQCFRQVIWEFSAGEHQGEQLMTKPGAALARTGCSNTAATGGAWAMRRETFDRIGGMYDCCVSGAGDTVTAMGAFGISSSGVTTFMNDAWKEHCLAWLDNARRVLKNASWVRGDVIVRSHGDRRNRQYKERHLILSRAGFDPESHCRIGDEGAVEWTAAAPADARNGIADYFVARREDDQ